jgi:ankyrin repeat protein
LLLLRRFANKRNLSGFTPLHYAVWGCCEPLVLSLLQAGADVSYVNDRVFDAWLTVPVGSTPLHLAVVRNHMPIALMLLQHYVSRDGVTINRLEASAEYSLTA